MDNGVQQSGRESGIERSNEERRMGSADDDIVIAVEK